MADAETHAKRTAMTNTAVSEPVAARAPIVRPRRRLRLVPAAITLQVCVCARRVARHGGVECLHGRAMDPRRHSARLCRIDSAGSRRPRRHRWSPTTSSSTSGDLLLQIDPTDYKIAVSLAEAAASQAQANAENVQRRA